MKKYRLFTLLSNSIISIGFVIVVIMVFFQSKISVELNQILLIILIIALIISFPVDYLRKKYRKNDI